jgi:hypothetical protein
MPKAPRKLNVPTTTNANAAPAVNAKPNKKQQAAIVGNAKPATPAAANKPQTTSDTATTTVPRGVNRTAATIAKQATNFGGTLSERDEAYFAFWASFAKRNNGTVTVTDIASSGRKPNYNGSAKPHDAGVAVRLAKAGIVAIHDNGHRIVFTDNGRKHKCYTTA